MTFWCSSCGDRLAELCGVFEGDALADHCWTCRDAHGPDGNDRLLVAFSQRRHRIEHGNRRTPCPGLDQIDGGLKGFQIMD